MFKKIKITAINLNQRLPLADFVRLPQLTHLIQLISSFVQTAKPELDVSEKVDKNVQHKGSTRAGLGTPYLNNTPTLQTREVIQWGTRMKTQNVSKATAWTKTQEHIYLSIIQTSSKQAKNSYNTYQSHNSPYTSATEPQWAFPMQL